MAWLAVLILLFMGEPILAVVLAFVILILAD